MFNFENLDVYRRAVDFAEDMQLMCDGLKGKIAHSFVDQLNRAALSIPLNIAEGNGRWHKNEKRQFFRISRGSVFEIVPLLEIARRRGMISVSDHKMRYEQLQTMSKMIFRLIESIDNLKRME